MGSDLKWCGKGHIPQISKQEKKLKLKENLNEKKTINKYWFDW